MTQSAANVINAYQTGGIGRAGLSLMNAVSVMAYNTASTPVDPTGAVDSSAGAKAAAAAALTGGQALFFPPGKYNVPSFVIPPGLQVTTSPGVTIIGNAALAAALAGTGSPQTTIMLIGDSQLVGVNVDGNGMLVGWRSPLYSTLRQWRSDFDFAGSVMSTGIPEGHGGLGLWYHEARTGFTMANMLATWPGAQTQPGIPAPNLIVDQLGTNDAANTHTLAQEQADRQALDGAYLAKYPNAKILYVGVIPFAAGSTVGANLAAWNANAVAYNTWLKTYAPANGYYFDPSFLANGGSYVGNKAFYQLDGLHLNRIGQARLGEAVAQFIDRQMLGAPRQGAPITGLLTRAFKQRKSAGSVKIYLANGAANTDLVQISSNVFAPGSGSMVVAFDYYPTILDSAAVHNVAQYAGGGAAGLWSITQQGVNLRVNWASGSPLWTAQPSDGCLTLNKWHRIMLIADASTLTVGLYVNAQLVGLAQGVSAWNMTTSDAFYIGNTTGFGSTGAPGYYSRVALYTGASAPRPGTMAGLSAAEDDYYLESGTVSGMTGQGYWAMDGFLTGPSGGANVTVSGNDLQVPGYPGGTPRRYYDPWDTSDSPGVTTLSTTGGASTVQFATQQSPQTLEISGTLGSNATVAVDLSPGVRLTVANLTSGAFTVTVIAAPPAAGTGFAIAQGKRAEGYVNTSATAPAFVRVTPDT